MLVLSLIRKSTPVYLAADLSKSASCGAVSSREYALSTLLRPQIPDSKAQTLDHGTHGIHEKEFGEAQTLTSLCFRCGCGVILVLLDRVGSRSRIVNSFRVFRVFRGHMMFEKEFGGSPP